MDEMKASKFTCGESVWSGSTWHGRLILCGKPAKFHEGGKHFCGIHNPERRRERFRKQDAEAESRIARRTLEAAAPAMYAALVDVQWANGGFCPQCAQGPRNGHQQKCLIGVALEKAVKL